LSLQLACAANPITGSLEPQTAIKVCNEKTKQFVGDRNRFFADAHLYTTLAITNIEKFEQQRQLTLSYYTQYPDIDRNYLATPVAIKYLFVPWRYHWRNNITGKLHSLHGGDSQAIEKRRELLKSELIQTIKDPDKDWLSGLIIHALGDAFAHTKNHFRSSHERAYNPWFGHAFASLFGVEPDKIKANDLNETKYLSYIREFYSTIKQDDSNIKLFNSFKEFVDDLECRGNVCPNFHAEFNPEDRINTKIEFFRDCMNKTARSLNSNEVHELFDLIE